jgi:hypothetical protein
MNYLNQNPYPVGCFPARILKAVIEALDVIQTTDVIASMSAWAAVSSAVGCNADWRHPGTEQDRPSALFMWVVALSGDRKTPADELMCEQVYAHDLRSILQHAEDSKTYVADQARWMAINKGLLSRISKLSRLGKSTAEAEVELAESVAKKPTRRQLQRIIRQDVTHRTVFEGLEGDGMSIALLTDEGQTLLDSNVMRHFGFLNKIWDGARLLTYDRANNDQIIALNPRATISMKVQPKILNQYLVKHGALAQGSGHWARYLIARSPSIQGFRLPTAGRRTLVDLLPFQERIAELLIAYSKKAADGCVTRDVLQFDDTAKEMWFNLATQVESDIKPGFFLSDISDFASKFMDIVGRLAALMHYFEAKTDGLSEDPSTREEQIGKISSETLRRAKEIAIWHLNEYKQVFSPPNQRTPEQLDADCLYAFLYRKYFIHQIIQVNKNLVRQYCGVRAGRYESAIRELISRQAIDIKIGKNKTLIIELNQHLFAAYPI